ncbi:MAG: translational GTPase TypA [bacterium TMED198]|nr:MAG: translational GTPase TypA [bacterium TMED198]
MSKNNFRNIAIIAHVDHGKTTLLDGMLRQGGTFRANQDVIDRVMDSMDLERERGITITAKNTSVRYNDIKINIIDTPGHADFGGEVERSLNLVDGALLLVDSSEGPLPQTRFVVKKALDRKLPVILVINKIDRKDARVTDIVNMVYDLFIDLNADEEQIEFPILYTNAKLGVAHEVLGDSSTSLKPLFDTIISYIPGPPGSDENKPQFLINNLAYDSYVGQVGIGRLNNGRLKMNESYSLCHENGITNNIKLSACYTFEGLQRIKVDEVESGDIIAVAGVEGIAIGDTISSQVEPEPLPRIKVDSPTISMFFYVNNGPFAGKEGKYLTSRNLRDRLLKEVLGNISLKVSETDRSDCFDVCGRGELQMAILIETMRREGYEFMVSKPQVITKKENEKTLEPMEKVYIDVPEEFLGVVTEKLSSRKGRMVNMSNPGNGRMFVDFSIPSRGLIGFRSQFLNDTKGSGILNSLFDGYKEWHGPIPQRVSGAIISDRSGAVTRYASLAMADRGVLFLDVGTQVYKGMVIGERNKQDDLSVNIVREKKLTNVRSSTSDATVTLKAPRRLSLDECLEFISEDELVEITPESIRLRKKELDENKRASMKKKLKSEQ